jgi:hypothetical protein
MKCKERISLGMCVAVITISQVASAADDGWRFGHDARDHPEITFIQSGKTVFYLGCGRAVGFHVMYPGQAGPGGPVTFDVFNSKKKLTYRGELRKGFDDGDESTPYVTSWNLGLDQGMPGLNKKLDDLFALITSPGPFTIAAGKGSYQLPPLEIPKIKASFLKDC